VSAGERPQGLDQGLDDVRAAFDPELFRREGGALVDLLADYLARAQQGAAAADAMPVLPWVPPDQAVADWSVAFPRAGATLPAVLGRVIARSNHLHHPRYVGHQVTPPLPEAALCDLVGSLLNNGSAVYEMGPVSTALERLLVRFLAGALGMPAGADGVFTSGGSAGNLTALLAARQARAGFDVWSEGNAAGPPLALLCSSQAHYSVARALQIMGLGARAAWPVPVDARFRMDAHALAPAKRAAEAAGRRVIGVVASAGSTATGAYDPLEPVASFCEAHGLWMHVDGAHGAAVALSTRHRGLLAGIARADSVVWDAHKLMLMPALVTAVIFRDGRRSYEPFAQDASYLFADARPDDSFDAQWFNLAGRTLECTKLMMSLKLYAVLVTRGPAFLAGYIEGLYALAAAFAERLAAAPDFELAVAPESNIVCFRYLPSDGRRGPALDALQGSVRQRLLERGEFYLVQTGLPGGVYLRVTLLNPFTTMADLEALLAAVRDAARLL
jgi:L-2,4-diaminobutyrate decarboxylase